MDLFEQYIELFHGLEADRQSHYMRRKLKPTPPKPYTPVSDERIEWFERLRDTTSINDGCSNEPSEVDVKVLRLLADNATNATMKAELGISYDMIKACYYRLSNFGLAELRSNRRYRPTEAGFAFLGIEPTEPPKQNCKRGQSIYFGRGGRNGKD